MANLHPAGHPSISLNITVDTRHIQYRYSTKAKPAEKLDIEIPHQEIGVTISTNQEVVGLGRIKVECTILAHGDSQILLLC